MKVYAILLLTLLCVSPPTAAQNAKVYDFQFGIVGKGPDGTMVVQSETTRIPLQLKESGFLFGYLVRERTGAQFAVKAVFTPPVRPRVVLGTLERVAETTIVSPETTHKGIVTKRFAFNEGDPPGDWKLEVHIDGVLFRVVRFQVVE